MGKEITSPVKKFQGTVTVKDPFLLPDAIAWERATDAADEMLDITRDEEGNITRIKIKDGVTPSEREGALIEGFKAVVEEWHLEGVDPDRFPLTPKSDVTNLIAWLLDEITKVYYGTTPNE